MNKYIKFITLVLFIIVVIYLVLLQNGNDTYSMNEKNQACNFSANIYLDKFDFIEGENIWINLSIKNLNDRIDSLPFLFHEQLIMDMNIQDKSGKKYNYHGPHGDYFGIQYCIFKPKEEKTYLFEIQSWYGGAYTKTGWELTTSYFKENEYYVNLVFKDLVDTSKTYFKTNTVTFKITKPSGIEEIAYNELKKIYQIPYSDIEPKCKNKVDAYLEFILKYPNSVYTEIAMLNSSAAISIFKYKYDDTFIQCGLNFLDKFPNSKINDGVLLDISGAMRYNNKSEKEINVFLSEIGNKYKGTRIEVEAKKIEEYFNNKYKQENKK